MGQKLPPEEIRLYRRIDEVLHYMWDPIGVAGTPQARDEYHAYLPKIFQLVLKKKTKVDTSSYLIEIETNRMEITANKDVAFEVAEILLNTRDVILDDGF